MIHYDKRGCGLSDRSAGLSSFPDRVNDMLAVMDAEGVDRAYIGGFSDGGTMSAFFAASYPERTEGLLLISTTPSWIRRDDLPWQPDLETWRGRARAWSDDWGSGKVSARMLAPTMVDDEDYVRWLARYERQAATPASVVKIWDVGPVCMPVRSSAADRM